MTITDGAVFGSAPIPAPSTSGGHVVQFYESDAFLVDRVSRFIGAGLEAGEAAIVIATRAHRDALAQRLVARGLDVAAARGRGWYLPLDAAETLSQFVIAGVPDAGRFEAVVGGSIVRAAAAARLPRVRAFGEMVALLWAQGNGAAALRLEQLWNEVGKRHEFALLCGYPIAGFREAAHAGPFRDIAAAHSEVHPTETFSDLGEPDERLRIVAELQQKAAALGAEVVQRRRLEDELRTKVEQLADVDRRKDEFLAMLGHELRNPLSPIVTALELMRVHAHDPSRVGRSRDIVERQVEHLTRLVDDLLDVSRITRGKIELRREELLLRSVIDRAVETARPAIDERGHRLAVELPDEAVRFVADPARLEQVLANLLNNAAKYTEVGGHIWLRARVDRGQVVISVKDDGAGLTAELRPHVFDLFVQGPGAGGRVRGGLGIGLTLVRRLVELHGGSVEALSDGPGLGSEFIVRLPLRQESAAPGLARTVPDETAAATRRRILIVDDNVDASESLAELLRDYGHQVRTAHDGSSAIEQATHLRPDVVLLDIAMPEVDGYQVARRLRREVGLASTLLVALSGYGEERHRRAAREAGFDQHLTKPVDLRMLEKLLEASPRT